MFSHAVLVKHSGAPGKHLDSQEVAFATMAWELFKKDLPEKGSMAVCITKDSVGRRSICWRYGIYRAIFELIARSSCRTSPTTPTTVKHDAVAGTLLSRLPIGLSLGQQRWASDSLTTITAFIEEVLPRSLKTLPRFGGILIEAKYRTAPGCLC
jgi:hypothetical protein